MKIGVRFLSNTCLFLPKIAYLVPLIAATSASLYIRPTKQTTEHVVRSIQPHSAVQNELHAHTHFHLYTQLVMNADYCLSLGRVLLCESSSLLLYSMTPSWPMFMSIACACDEITALKQLRSLSRLRANDIILYYRLSVHITVE